MSEHVGHFGERLVSALATKAPLCAGIDPHPELLEAWGVGTGIDGLRRFTETCIDSLGPVVAMVKPQVAFYEAYGSEGFAVLERLVRRARDLGVLVLADAKRGDIGSTMQAYARTWLAEDSPLRADAVTVSPYLGMGSLRPAFELAQATGRGVFVLAATSNPEAVGLQCATLSSGARVSQHVVDEVARLNAVDAAQSRPGSIGVVVGSTVTNPPRLAEVNGPVLLPGVGAQGGTLQDVAAITKGVSHLAVPSVSRAILSAGPDGDDLRQRVLDFSASQ